MVPVELEWEGSTPFDSRLEFAVRGAESREGLRQATWQRLAAGSGRTNRVSAAPHRWWQYRVTFMGGRAAWPTMERVRIRFDPAAR